VPQTGQPISAVSGPKFAILSGHVEEVLLLNKLCNGAQMAIFGDFFASCIFSEPRAARFRPAS